MLGGVQKAAWTALFLCFLSGFGFAVWTASQQSPAHNHQQPTKSENQNRPSRETVVESISEKDKEKGRQENHWYRELLKPTDWLLVIFTGFLVLYTKRLYGATSDLRDSTEKLWEAGERQIEVARDAFNSTHRPRIRFKHVYLVGTIPEDGGPTSVQMAIVNNGPTDALNMEYGARLEVRKTRDALPAIPQITPVARFDRLPSGISLPLPSLSLTISATESSEIVRGLSKLYCIGFIHYRDGGGSVRTTAWCRVLTPHKLGPDQWKGRFSVVDDPDYEYQD
jgi:hypothetical protein